MPGKVAIRLTLFFSLLLAGSIVIDMLFKEFSVHNLVNNTMDRQFAGYTDTLQYLTLGNSHNCVNTHILQNSFNYGSPSENYIQSYYKLKYILEKSGKKPQHIILQSDISSFGPKIAARYEYNSYWIRYIDYIELARIKKSRDVLSRWLEGTFFSYAGNYKDIQLSILYRIKIKKLEMYNGYRPHRDYRNFADQADKQKEAREKALLILSKESFMDPTIRVYFEKILQLCQEHGVRVYLIRIPMTREFYGEETKIVPAKKLYDEVSAIAARYAVYDGMLDYHDLFFDHPEYFFDPDHLNIKGSDLFTEQLVSDLKQLGSGGFSE